MSSDLSPDDLSGASEELLDLLREQSEKRLTAQAQLMASADSRANAILAASVALSAAAIATAAGQMRPDGSHALIVTAGTFFLFTAGAALASFTALWPTEVAAVGWTAKSFVGDIQARKTTRRIKAEMVALLHRRVTINRACASRLSSRIKVAMLLLSMAPVGALAVGLYGLGHLQALIAAFIAAVAVAFITHRLSSL